jgi:adenosylcobinamide-phosphate synthase
MFSSDNYLILAVAAPVALLIDAWLGEAKRFHPLVGFGLLVNKLEHYLNPTMIQNSPVQRLSGILGIILLAAPFVGVAYLICHLSIMYFVANTVLLYFAIGHKSLHTHANAVANALNQNNIEQAKKAASYMVSRDLEAIEPISATIESTLENGNDAVFGALFWFYIAGGAGAVLFRLVNTLDAMWGYKTPRHLYFGWATARLDDILNYIPARLTALTYALSGHTRLAFRCWRQQAPFWDSPNAGPVMSAGAGALNIKLGGAARYHGEWHERTTLGAGESPTAADIERALALVRHSVYRWLIIVLLIAATLGSYHA